MLNSVRNSESMNISLLDQMTCDKFFCTAEFTVQINNIKKMRPGLQVMTIPSFDEMVASPAEHYVFDKSWAEAQDEHILICHTSGSTGKLDHIGFTTRVVDPMDQANQSQYPLPMRTTLCTRRRRKFRLIRGGRQWTIPCTTFQWVENSSALSLPSM